MTGAMAISTEERLAGELARGDAMIASAGPILRHMLTNDDHSLFSDEIVARLRGSLLHVSRQLLGALGDAAGAEDSDAFAADHADGLVKHFFADTGFLIHAHSLALEAQLARRLKDRTAIDPVVPPLVQSLIASNNAATATEAMKLLAAQARFLQQQSRMELPLKELPGDLFHRALQLLSAYAGAESEDLVRAANEALRADYDEARTRLGLLARLITGMGASAVSALSLSHAGVAGFATALSIASGQDRPLTVLALNERRGTRLALMLRASGVKVAAIEEQFAYLMPDTPVPAGMDSLRIDQATAILSRADTPVDGVDA